MHAIRQKCRPKHQVLILKCYPQTTKGAVDVKPNSSELSYLLYYATTRRSKVQKVGAFLEKKTASDVWRARIGNVQVTLQILASLIEKAPRDLPLYAAYVLRIINLILHSKDITMVESSIPTFEAFCEHHDAASLSADQEYLRLYQETIKMYASFASMSSQSSKGNMSRPVAMRWRGAGLQAIKSVASSEALASVAGRQLDVIMPALLENIWTDDHEYLGILIHRVRLEEKVDTEKLLRRRTSIATVATAETSGDANPLALSGSTADADKLAEEDIGVLAMQCLKQVFVGNNRTQIRDAAIATNKFIAARLADQEILTDTDPITGHDNGWATTIFMVLTRWAPVQDRYIILITAMDALIQSPLTEQSIPQQLVLATMIGSLLRSDINLIGLSVMDVLLGLIQHILRILQLGGVPAHFQQTDFDRDVFTSQGLSSEPSPATSAMGTASTEKVNSPSNPRIELLARLQQCIGDLATHVYYADQISDMIAAILLRLKPPTSSSISSTAAAIENPEKTANIVSASGNLYEDPSTDGFFSFDTAKVTALNAIKSIILVANNRGKLSGAANLGRNRVGLKVWEGTQWLLRDPDGRVRKAYVDALLTWLEKEVTRSDLKAFEEKQPHRSSSKGLTRNGGDSSGTNLARRAVSNASRPDRSARPGRTSFLQLLHLAVYENALQYIDYESDVILLHLLLTTLVERLGVNAVTSGLPMIFRLQEDIQEVETMAKVRMGSLCHGYFWALTDRFDFESSGVGHEIQSEIQRRRSKGFWVDLVRQPPVPLEHIGLPGQPDSQGSLPYQIVETESLKPYDDRETMVELISVAYTESMASPPSSPPTSPGRGFVFPVISGATVTDPDPAPQIPESAKEAMLSDWSREAVLEKVQESSKTVSMTGSKAGTNVTAGRNFLAVNGQNNGTASGTQSPHYHSQGHGQHRSRPPSQAYGLVGSGNNRLRKTSLHDSSPTPLSDSSRSSIARLDHLKRVLEGQAPPSRDVDVQSDGSSDSMVSYDGGQSELSYDNRGVTASELTRQASSATAGSQGKDRQTSVELSRALASHPTNALTEMDETLANLESVPPVPPLPPTINLPGAFPSSSEKVPTLKSTAQQDFAFAETGRQGRATASRSGRSNSGSVWGSEAGASASLDLESMLRGIDTKGMNGTGVGNVSRPPY